MKFVPFVLKNLMRNPLRSALTVLSVAFFLFLHTTLFTVLSTMNAVMEEAGRSLNLAVRDRYSMLGSTLPYAYVRKVAEMPHVEGVAPFSFFGGTVRSEADLLFGFASIPEILRLARPELDTVPPEGWACLRAERTGSLMGREPLDRYGWKVGDVVILHGTTYPVDLTMTICGVVETGLMADNFVIRDDYFQQATGDRGIVNTIWVRVDRAENIPAVVRAIDGTFDREPVKTKTETERAFLMTVMSTAGNVEAVIRVIAFIVLAAAVMVTANTIAMSARERTLEGAVLRTLGYGRGHLLGFILAESGLLSLAGGLAGCAAAWLAWSWTGFSFRLGPQSYFVVTPGTVIQGIGISLAAGLIAGAVPAVNQARATVVATLREAA